MSKSIEFFVEKYAQKFMGKFPKSSRLLSPVWRPVRRFVLGTIQPADSVRKVCDSGGLHKSHESLLAANMLEKVKFEDSNREKVIILTAVPFWRGKVGNHARIASLFNYLSNYFDVFCVYTEELSLYDAKKIFSSGLSGKIHPLINNDNIFDYEFAKIGSDVKNRSLFLKKKYLADFLEVNPCKALIVEYITLEPLVRGVTISGAKIIDTHDLMSERVKAYSAFGRDHHIKISAGEEFHRLSHFDAIVAIQKNEARLIKENIVGSKVLTCHHCSPITKPSVGGKVRRIVYIAGTNPANVDSIVWFFKSVWPEVDSKNAVVHLYGKICIVPRLRSLVEKYQDSVCLHGEVDTIDEAYEDADIVINPVLYGGGLKIKSVEAVCRAIPMVTTPEGANGLEEWAESAFFVAESPAQFSRYLSELIANQNIRETMAEGAHGAANELFSERACFGELKNYIVHFSKSDDNLAPPPNIVARDEKLLVIGEIDFPLFKGLEQYWQIYKKVIFKRAVNFLEIKELKRILKFDSIDRVFFLNPYLNDITKILYLDCKKNNIPFVCFDRGALPGSWFFDVNGFNADSCSYAIDRWDFPLSDIKKDSALNYISWLTNSNVALEKQGPRCDSDKLRQKLNVYGKKVLFIPFQRPLDTVVRCFSGGQLDFNDFVTALSSALSGSGWAVIGKKHPLENEFHVNTIKQVPNDIHVHDLIEISDAVLTINSGVGLISLFFNKPVFCWGDSFYSHEGLARKVSSVDEMLEYLQLLAPPCNDKLLRFCSFLLNDFYSFGKDSGYKREEENGTVPITTGIDFEKIITAGNASRLHFDDSIRRCS